MKKPNSLQEAILYFSDEQRCIAAFARMRWPNGVACPACETKEPWWIRTQKRWKCRDCRRQFSVKLGTIFEDSAIPLQKWMPALWMLCNCKNGVSSHEIARALRVTQKSAWFMLHRLRLAMQQSSLAKIGGSGTPVEVDETFIGGKARNMHLDRKRRMRVTENNWAKTVVVGMLERGGKVKAKVIPERIKSDVQNFIHANLKKGAHIITDEFPGYRGLSGEYAHEVINHADAYVRGLVHTNGLENFWSLLKRGLSGTYVSVEPFHLFRYVDEQAFRFNSRKDASGRKISDGERFDLALSQIAGKRLSYSELTGKVGETAPF